MLTQFQKNMLSLIAEEHGVAGVAELFKLSLVMLDTDTSNYIVTHYAHLFDEEELEAMQQVTAKFNVLAEELIAAEAAKELADAVVH